MRKEANKMQIEDMSKRIKELRQAKGLTLEQVANVVGVGKSTVRKWETGMIANMKRDKIADLAKALGTTPAYLMGWEDRGITDPNIRPVNIKRFPMLGNVACGEPIFANEDRESFVDASADIKADFCLTAKGDSMINARIFDGDILFVKSQPTVEDGEIAVVLIENEATVKRVYYDRENNIITLVPENPTYKPMRYIGEQLDQIRILGKVIAGQYNI